MTRYLLAFTLPMCLFMSAPSFADCLKVADDTALKVNPTELADLAKINIDRAGIFAAMMATAIPETEGCWAGGTGDFDGQLLSVGFAQWNYGQGSLQPILMRYRSSFATTAEFESERDRLMGRYGKLFFSADCLRTERYINRKGRTDRHHAPNANCVAAIRGLQTRGRLNADFASEVNALFETLQMRQIETDTFVKLLGSVRSDLARLYPNRSPSGRQIKWAIDTKVQQGGFPADEDLARVRSVLATVPAVSGKRSAALTPLIDWYSGLAGSLDQQGTRWDLDWNRSAWRCVIDNGVDDEQFELLYLTFLKSRTAGTKSGLYQALTFQRRVKIILGVGSVGGRREGSCKPVGNLTSVSM